MTRVGWQRHKKKRPYWEIMWLSIGQEHRLDLMELVTDVGIDKIMELLTSW